MFDLKIPMAGGALPIVRCCLNNLNRSQQITAYQYYFDTDPGVGIAGNGAIVPGLPQHPPGIR
ncbi:MAG: hypothetical protein IPN26_10675 [Bacteroidetes bacterium]|nr:hypothetical protein [Bacteroidota bacterium]